MTLLDGSAALCGRLTSLPRTKYTQMESSPINGSSQFVGLTSDLSLIETLRNDSAADSRAEFSVSGAVSVSCNLVDACDSKGDLEANSSQETDPSKDAQGESPIATSPFDHQRRRAVVKKPLRVTRQIDATRKESPEATKGPCDAYCTPLRSRRTAAIQREEEDDLVKGYSAPQIHKVRSNRAFEKRYSECQQLLTLRSARHVSYRMYLVQATAMQRVPQIELAAGFP